MVTKPKGETMTKKKRKLKERLVDEIIALSIERDAADARMLIRLVEIERDHLDDLIDAGCDSYANFLYECHVSPRRYGSFKAGLSKLGKHAALKIGTHGVQLAVLLDDGEKIPANADPALALGAEPRTDDAKRYVAEIENWSVQNGSKYPSRQTVDETILKNFKTRPRPSRGKTEQLKRLQDENARLRAENEELRAESRSLAHRLYQTEDELRKCKSKRKRKKKQKGVEVEASP